jgi:hypothetical protein
VDCSVLAQACSVLAQGEDVMRAILIAVFGLVGVACAGSSRTVGAPVELTSSPPLETGVRAQIAGRVHGAPLCSADTCGSGVCCLGVESMFCCEHGQHCPLSSAEEACYFGAR